MARARLKTGRNEHGRFWQWDALYPREAPDRDEECDRSVDADFDKGFWHGDRDDEGPEEGR